MNSRRSPGPDDPTGAPHPTRTALVWAILTGLASVLTTAWGIAQWSHWLVEVDRDQVPGPHDGLVGQQGLLLAEGLVALSFSVLGAVLLQWHWMRSLQKFSLDVIRSTLRAAFVLRLACTTVLVAVHWRHGWSHLLSGTAPKGVLLLAALQATAFALASASHAAPARPPRTDGPDSTHDPDPSR